MQTSATFVEQTSLKRPKSEECYKRLCEVIPGGVNSPVRACKGLDLPAPIVAERAVGDLLYDVDGNCYIDYCGSWGPLIHGHAHPKILAAAQKRMAMGTTFGITTSIEEKLARAIIKHMPAIEKIRFVSSGTEATMSAIRLARGFTKRDIIVKFSGNYHGHADFLLVKAGSGVMGLTPTSTSSGVPQEIVHSTACLPYNDVEACRKFFLDPINKDRIAAVIVEPIAGNIGCVPGTPEFLKTLRELTNTIGAVLIFDEVISGFRVSLGGAQQQYHITPDLTCLGKIIGGGFPAAAFGGRREIMDCLAPLGTVYQAGTLSGNPVAMEAGLMAIQMLEEKGLYQELLRKTNLLIQPISQYIQKNNLNACIQQVGSMFTLFFGQKRVSNMEEAAKCDMQKFAHFFRYMLSQGVYIPPMQQEAWFVSTAHEDQHLEQTRDAILGYLSHVNV